MRISIFVVASVFALSAILVGCGQSADTIEPLASPTTQVTVDVEQVSFANTKCPIMGGTPTDELTTEYAGKTIGFCCDGCPQKWATLSEQEQAEKFASVRIESAEDGHEHAGHGDPSHTHDHEDHADEDHVHEDTDETNE